MDTLPWDTVRGEFVFDGSWRDIVVFGTDLNDWQRMLDAIRSGGYEVAYYRADKPSDLPAKASDAFPLPGESDRRLSVWFAEVLANCHFFQDNEIEFDVDPREVKGQRELDALFEFMRCLAQAVNKSVLLTAENMPEIVVFRVRPGALPIEYQEFGGFHEWKQ